MRFISPMVIATCMLQALAASANTEEQSAQRQCSVVNGVIECSSKLSHQPDLSVEQLGKSVVKKTRQKHGPLLGYGSPGYRDSQSRFTAIIVDKNGRESRREVRLKYLENTPDGNKRLLIFDKPLDLKRHAMLTLSHPEGDDEHWEYNPENQQVKRILSNNSAIPFSGSEFNFEDLSSQDLAKYEYRFERKATFEGALCSVVNRFPKDKRSDYQRLETWIDTQTYLIHKIDYYDRDGKLFKTLTARNYELFNDKHWRAKQVNIYNHQSGKSTQLLWSDYQFNTGLVDKDFSLTSLRNVN